MSKPHPLSKSKIMSGLQCEKRLWFEIHLPDQEEDGSDDSGFLSAGYEVQEVARSLVPDGALISHTDRLSHAIEQTHRLLSKTPPTPIFEAAFEHDGVFAHVDLLFPAKDGCRLVEVKASKSMKDHYLTDCAIQAWVLREAGFPISKVELAHLSPDFVYQGDGVYDDLFHHEDVTDRIAPMVAEVPSLVERFRKVLAGREPNVEPGDHCHSPHDCPFQDHCWPEEAVEYPVSILPRGRSVISMLMEEGYTDLREVPQGRLTNPRHEWVRQVTVSGEPYVGRELVNDLRDLPYPRYYLDFETIREAVPKWKGTTPYHSHLPFQWSCHIENAPDVLQHEGFLDFSDPYPLPALTEKLIAALKENGPILVWGTFENTVINRLKTFLPHLEAQLNDIQCRLLNLHPLFYKHYYHPDMRGSWSIKSVLPAIVPDLRYDALDGVADGTAAQSAYSEAMRQETSEERRQALFKSLWEYCRLDTLAMVKIVQVISKASLRGGKHDAQDAGGILEFRI